MATLVRVHVDENGLHVELRLTPHGKRTLGAWLAEGDRP